MNKLILALWVVLGSLCMQGQNLPWVKVEGKNLVLGNGETFVFQALNASDPDKLEKDGHWNDAYFQQISSWGAQMVRFPIHPSAWRNRGKKKYLKLLDRGIRLAEQNGMYVILDWHSIGNLKTEKYQNKRYYTTLKETQKFWKTMAKRYGQNSTVAFFELFNEPTTMRGELGDCDWADWKILMEDIINMIRKKKAKNIPLVAGFNWAYDLTEIKENPIISANIGYVSHPYPQKKQQPWAPQWEKDWGHVADTYPVVLTEIGFCAADARGAHIPVISEPDYVEKIMGYAKSKGISFVVWVFDPVWSPMLIEDWTYQPTKAGAVWKKALMSNH